MILKQLIESSDSVVLLSDLFRRELTAKQCSYSVVADKTFDESIFSGAIDGVMSIPYIKRHIFFSPNDKYFHSYTIYLFESKDDYNKMMLTLLYYHYSATIKDHMAGLFDGETKEEIEEDLLKQQFIDPYDIKEFDNLDELVFFLSMHDVI